MEVHVANKEEHIRQRATGSTMNIKGSAHKILRLRVTAQATPLNHMPDHSELLAGIAPSPSNKDTETESDSSSNSTQSHARPQQTASWHSPQPLQQTKRLRVTAQATPLDHMPDTVNC